MVEQEYKFILVYDTAREHWVVDKFAKMGADGWIFRGQVVLGEEGPHYVFSRPKLKSLPQAIRPRPVITRKVSTVITQKMPVDTD